MAEGGCGLTGRELDLIRYIETHDGVSPERLSERLGVSTRTVRTRIHQANDDLGGIAHIEKKRGDGYSLIVDDEDAFAAWRADETSSVPSHLPSNHDERVAYLLDDLLARNDWITLDDLSSMLYVSRNVISNDLKDVEQELDRFDLVLEKRPHYGIRITGSELNRRICMADLVINRLGGYETEDVEKNLPSISLDVIADCVNRILEEEHFSVNADAYQNLLVHIAIAVRRIRADCFVPLDEEHLDSIRSMREFSVAQRIADEVGGALSVDLPEEEVGYIAIHLAGKQAIYGTPDDGSEGGLVISDEVWDVVTEMLEVVWKAFHFDFRNDLELRMNLARHIVPLSVRLRYHMHIDNPMLPDIKERYPLAYSMALDSSAVLVEHYGTRLSEDETGYIALAFELALERQKTELPRKNILVVCASGQGSAKLLEYRYRQEFGAYLGDITTCNAIDLDSIDFTNIDYVFTTVPINRTLPVPVREVKYFFNDADARSMRALLNDDLLPGDVARYFDPQLFLPHLELGSKGEVLDLLCACVAEHCEVPDDFRELVERREQAAQTAFGNLVAMPHPIQTVTSETFVCVGVLERPIEWDEQQVQVVFLVSISKERNKDLSQFYGSMAKLVMNSEAVQELVENQTFSELLLLLEQCGTTEEKE